MMVILAKASVHQPLDGWIEFFSLKNFFQSFFHWIKIKFHENYIVAMILQILLQKTEEGYKYLTGRCQVCTKILDQKQPYVYIPLKQITHGQTWGKYCEECNYSQECVCKGHLESIFIEGSDPFDENRLFKYRAHLLTQQYVDNIGISTMSLEVGKEFR